ncbi:MULTISPECIES: GntR family transcriptional regulator [unclassified Crossiella]|uniref:GntR family transcriptional regulator n=1 Tax=unclassified Crossiella TaxID=2620835 RepID=UPI0020001CA5|nr:MULTISPECIES: GntR family transcriptional regulator [unclassified Crossiella]MCK2239269.1 GntR family transcriptional regulator [Crossiella sp. S99.2]MCK2251161.1 GntR family transcriptional regulator [Crossiella sp. S99.1]
MTLSLPAVATHTPALTATWWTRGAGAELIVQLTGRTSLDLCAHQRTESAERVTVRLAAIPFGPAREREVLTTLRLRLDSPLRGREVLLIVDGRQLTITAAPSWTAPAEEPRYYWAKARILELIDQLGPGAGLPSERELVQRLGVARMTLRQAMIELASEGRVFRKRGSGTFVAAPKLVQDLAAAGCDRTEVGQDNPARLLVTQEYLPADLELALQLDLAPGELVLHLRRLLVNGPDTLLLESSYLPADRFPGLTSVFDPAEALLDCLREHYDVTVARTVDQISAALCDPHEATLLDVAPTVPMLALDRIGYDRTGAPVHRVRSLFRGDRFSLRVHNEHP